MRPAHEQRVMHEARTLKYRMVKLNAFLDTEPYKKLDTAEQDRLRRQAVLMQQYADVLHERIEAFKEKKA